jgi:hypothetical protein
VLRELNAVIKPDAGIGYGIYRWFLKCANSLGIILSHIAIKFQNNTEEFNREATYEMSVSQSVISCNRTKKTQHLMLGPNFLTTFMFK